MSIINNITKKAHRRLVISNRKCIYCGIKFRKWLKSDLVDDCIKESGHKFKYLLPSIIK